MKEENHFPKRKRIRIENYDYSVPGMYYITICTVNREKIFWDRESAESVFPQAVPLSIAGKIAQEAVRQISEHYTNVFVDKYCIMPDHIHLIVSISADANGRMVSAPTVSTVVGSMKRWVSRQIGRAVWQKSFYEHSIRNKQDYIEIWNYIDNNPLKYLIE